MRERVSRQRRETALQVAREILDPEYRRRQGLGTDLDVPVLVALWSDRLEDVLVQMAAEGDRAVIAVRRPDGALASLALKRSSVSPSASSAADSERLTVAPGATVGMLLDAYGREGGNFSFVLASSPLEQFNLVVAAAP
jgi:hypothetical protein